MIDPQMGVPGPHDPELVDLLIDKFNKYLDGPMAEYLNTNLDFLNEVVDGINTIFEPEIDNSWRYEQLN